MRHANAAIPLICGCVAIIVAVAPGLLDQLLHGIENFRLLPWLPVPRRYRRNDASRPKLHSGFLALGIAFILLSLFA